MTLFQGKKKLNVLYLMPNLQEGIDLVSEFLLAIQLQSLHHYRESGDIAVNSSAETDIVFTYISSTPEQVREPKHQVCSAVNKSMKSIVAVASSCCFRGRQLSRRSLNLALDTFMFRPRPL